MGDLFDVIDYIELEYRMDLCLSNKNQRLYINTYVQQVVPI